MPSQQSNSAAIRADSYSARVYASFFRFRVVASGTLTSGPVYPSGSISPFIATTYVTGAYTDLERDQEVTFHDPVTDALKGRTHIRRGGVINVGTFPIPEFSQAKLNLQTGDVFKVWDEYRLHPRIVAATASFDPEQEFHTDEGSNPPPRILTGGAWAGWVDDGELFAPVPFDYTESRNTDPDSTSTNVGFLTQTQTGVVVASGYADTDDQIVLEIDASSTAYTVTVEGTDTDNSKVTLRQTPVMVHDETHPPHQVLLTSYEGSADNGFNFTIEVVDGAVDLATIPDGCLCVLWTKERYNDQWQAFRNTAPGREHIIGTGYVNRDTTTGSADGVVATSFEVVSPLARLKSITSYSKVMEENATPDAWSEVKTLGVVRAILQLFQFYTNFAECFDLDLDNDLLDERYPALYLQRSNFYDQSKELLDGIDARMTCDRTGRFSLHTFPPFIPLASRAAITKAWRFTRLDVLDWEISRIHFDPVEQYKTSGFSGGTANNRPVFSLYPGAAPGEGTDAPTRDRLIVDETDPQGDLNERTGRYGALADDVYQDADGLRWRAFEVRLTLRGGYNFFDFEKEFVDFTESLRDLERTDMTDYLFYLTAVSWSTGSEFNDGETTATFRVATNAAPGETFVPLSESDVQYPGWDGTPFQPPLTLPPSLSGQRPGTGRWAIPNTNGMFYVTTDGHTFAVQGGPTYIEIDPGHGADMTDCVQAPYMQARFIFTSSEDDGIYTFDDILGAATLTKRTIAFQAALTDLSLQNRHIEADFSAGYIRVVTFYGSGLGTWETHSSDNGATWSTEAQLTAHYNSNNGTNENGLHVSSHVANRYYVGVYTASGAGATAAGEIYRYDAGVATPTGVSLLDSAAYTLHFPFNNNSSESEFYYSAVDFSLSDAARNRLFRRNGGSSTDITPVINGSKQRALYNRSIHAAPLDSNYVAAAVAGNGEAGVVLSKNKGAIWAYPDVNGAEYSFIEIDGQNKNIVYMVGFGGVVGYSSDFATIDDRRGNLATFLTIDRHIRLYGI